MDIWVGWQDVADGEAEDGSGGTLAILVIDTGGIPHSLGARGGVPGWNTANTLQGNGQSTQPIPTQYIPSSFRVFQANFLAVFPGQ